MDEEKQLYTISEASREFDICRQGIFLSIRSGRLKAEMINGVWSFTKENWDIYRNSKYDREFTVRNGKKLYDRENGMLSPTIIEKMYGIDRQKIYYYARIGLIPFERSGSSYLIKKEDIEKNKETLSKNRTYERKRKKSTKAKKVNGRA